MDILNEHAFEEIPEELKEITGVSVKDLKELGTPKNIDVWNILDIYFRERGLVYHKLEPYDIFLESAKDIIRTYPPIRIEDNKSQNIYQYSFGNVCILSPTITPNEARLSNRTYNISIVADIIQGFYTSTKSSTQNVSHNVKIAEIPLMLRSKYCHTYQKSEQEMIKLNECDHDIGGYYIVNGKERCIIVQERIEYNRIFTWKPYKDKEKKAYKMMSEIRSTLVQGSKPSITKIFIKSNKQIVCQLSGLSQVIPIGVVLYATGIFCGTWGSDCEKLIKSLIINDTESDEIIDIVNNIEIDECDYVDIVNKISQTPISKADKEEFAKQVFKDELLVHIPTHLKPYFLCYMIRKLIDVYLKNKAEDDRDHFANKRCDTDGKLLEDLFRGYFAKYIENITKSLNSHPNNFSVFERDITITKGIQYCMSTGNWSIQKIGYKKVGVCQLMTRLNYITALSHLRRITSNRSSESRAMKLRHLHNSQWGVCDPAETPEGPYSGILKNMAIGAHITSGSSVDLIKEFLKDNEYISIVNPDTFKYPKVFLNGSIIGIVKAPGILLGYLKEARKLGKIHHEVSISYKSSDKELHILCDSGRCSRPLLVVKNNKLVIPADTKIESFNWHELISAGYIQYVDTLEEQTSYISTYVDNIMKDSNYCEIHPATILGVCCSIIPFCNHNQSPRNAYSGNMSKQAIGIFASNFMQRFETTGYMLHYPQRPLVIPRMAKYFGYNELTTGVNCIVACMIYQGFGQEDSIIINKSAVQRGLFAVTVYKTYTAEEKNQDNQTIETIEAPTSVNEIDKYKNYLKLDERGIIKEGKIVKENDIIIRKTVRKDGKNGQKIDISVVHKFEETGFVDKVLVTQNSEGNKLVKVRIGFIRMPIMGDKFASVHAQKGTCGILIPQEDMPYTSEGIVPDIIINPHSIPSRMTIGHLIECITGKVSVLDGNFSDGTPFNSNDSHMVNHIEQIGNSLHMHGYDKTGEEVMYSGITGERLTGTVFIGPTYYRRLKHMVIDKLSARSEGPFQNFTRQPANNGRKNGIKFTSTRMGNMEVDGFISHGAGAALNERMLHSSDKYVTDVCNKCGEIVKGDICKCKAGVTSVVMPYAFKLFHHNITSMMIKASLQTENSL